MLAPRGTVRVGVDVTNTGTRAGADVAQVYVADPAAVGEPPRQLKGFQKVMLAPGQTKHLTFTLDERAFSTWDSAAQNWGTADGHYGILVGDSSRSLPLRGDVTIPRTLGTQAVAVSAPGIAAAGSTAPATTTFTNTGDFAVGDVHVGLHAPSGWAAHATSPASFAVVAPRSSVHTTWQVSVPATAGPGRFTLTRARRISGGSGASPATATGDVNVPFASLAAAYDNTGHHRRRQSFGGRLRQ